VVARPATRLAATRRQTIKGVEMGIAVLDHYSTRTLKPSGTRAFRVDGIGLKGRPRPPFKLPGVWFYRDDKAVVHVAAINPENPAATADYLGIKGDLDVVGTGILRQAGIEPRERSVSVLGRHRLFVGDPNGLTIGFNCPAAEAA
jgi:hypothetical protein